MPLLDSLAGPAMFLVAALPGGACLWLGARSLLGFHSSERHVARCMRWVFSLALACALAAGVSLYAQGVPALTLRVGGWKLTQGLDFRFVLQLDRLSLPFVLLSTSLCGLVAAFSERYLHRESGYQRYFFLLCVFSLGYNLTILAGSIEVLYASWELLGLSSAMLIGFFQERPGPVRNGLYAFIVYRFCDLGLILASVFVFSNAHAGAFQAWLGQGYWPHCHSALSSAAATVVGFLLLLSAAGKAAQFPFSGWLPRAMEGPTPSTAVFYGALSVHAGAYLMLRGGSLLDASPVLSLAVFALGLTTALYARLVGKVQTDRKCSLAYSSLAHVGLIFAEIGLGLRWLPVVHAIGHASLRSIQFLKAPSVLHHIHEMQTTLEGYRPGSSGRISPALYAFSMEKGYLEVLQERLLLRPFYGLCSRMRRLDAWVLRKLVGPEP
ncbi:MAG: proton-conducting transporter membrane subunit [Vulcanimicrobiota bacterium]